MARFDVYRPARKNPKAALFLDVQASTLERDLGTRVVVPLTALGKFASPIGRLNPIFKIGDRSYVANVSDLAAISVSELGVKIETLQNHHFEIVQALDFLFQGF
jgi:toxin CcdB